MISLDFLRNVDILKGLSDEQLNAIGKLCREESHMAEDVLFTEGQSADHLFLTAEGTVDLSFTLPGVSGHRPPLLFPYPGEGLSVGPASCPPIVTD